MDFKDRIGDMVSGLSGKKILFRGGPAVICLFLVAVGVFNGFFGPEEKEEKTETEDVLEQVAIPAPAKQILCSEEALLAGPFQEKQELGKEFLKGVTPDQIKLVKLPDGSQECHLGNVKIIVPTPLEFH